MASAPSYDEVMKADGGIEAAGAEGGIEPPKQDLGVRRKEPGRGTDPTKKVKKEPKPSLPFNLEDKVPGSEEDQKTWDTKTTMMIKRPDQTEEMILIYKNPDSNSKTNVKQLCKEYLAKLGWGNLEFPTGSVELAEDAFPDEIWGYVLRYMKNDQDTDPTISTVPKASTNALFIKENV